MKKTICITIFCILSVIACTKDFIAVNIDKKTVTVNAPGNNLSTTNNLITFWWEALDGAETYNLQIVRPDFSKIEKLVLDTIIIKTKFSWALSPGTYQWRIKAVNGGHSTAYQTFNLEIDTTSDLTEQLVGLLSPIDGAITGNTVIAFSWKPIVNAKKYQFELTNNGVVIDTTITSSSLTFTVSAAKNATTVISWNVKAINDLTQSQFNTDGYKIIIDRKGPATPNLLFPADSGTLSNSTDSLKWSHASDTNLDSIYVSNDSSFISSATVLSTNNLFIQISEFNLSPGLPATFYYWKVRSFDLYNNASAFSLRHKFILK